MATLGSILGGFLDRVDQSIQRAINEEETAIINVEVEAARQVSVLVQNLQNLWQSDLQQLATQVNATVNNILGQIGQMVTGIEQSTQDIINQIDTDAQTIVNSLGFGNHPQVTRMLPSYVVVGLNATEVFVKVQGNFVWASTAGYKPTLTLEGQSYPEISNQTNSLEFQVPIGIFNTQIHNCALTTGSLQVPWAEREWIFWKKNSTDTFNLWIGALPLTPGTITVTYTSQKVNRVFKNVVQPGSCTFQVGGARQQTASANTDPNWQLLIGNGKSSFAFDVPLENLPFQAGPPIEYVTHVDFNVSLRDNWQVDNTEPVPYHIGFTEFQDQNEPIPRTVPVDLRWGDSVVLEPNPGEEVTLIDFNAFDGSHQQFAGVNQTNPYLKVTNEGGFLKLEATVPTDH